MNPNYKPLESALNIFNAIKIDGLSKYKIDPDHIIIGYNALSFQVTIKEIEFNKWTHFISNEGKKQCISWDDIAYFSYHITQVLQIILWNENTKLDRIFVTGNTKNEQSWSFIAPKFLTKKIKNEIKKKLIKKINQPKNNDDSKIEDDNRTILTINKEYENNNKYKYYWNKQSSVDIIKNEEYLITNKLTGKEIKVDFKKENIKLVKNTKVYDSKDAYTFISAKQLDQVYRIYNKMEIEIVNEYTIDAVYRIKCDKNNGVRNVVALNYASEYFNINYAKDEFIGEQNIMLNCFLHKSLCKYINKLNVNQNNKNIEYKENKKYENYLYNHSMIYSPGVIIFEKYGKSLTKDEIIDCNFITSIPVNGKMHIKSNLPNYDNKKQTYKYIKKQKNKIKKLETQNDINKEIIKLIDLKDEIDKIMEIRIRKIIEICILNGNDCIILGGFGCQESLGNDIKKIAKIFRRLLSTIYYNCFQKVIFAIHEQQNRYNIDDGKDKIIDIFCNSFIKEFGNNKKKIGKEIKKNNIQKKK